LPKRDFLWFVDQSVALLCRDVPEAHAAVKDAADGLRIGVRSPTVRGTVWMAPDAIEVFGPVADTDVEVLFDERVVVDLLDGVLSMREALDRGRLELKGSNASLEKLISGLKCYIRGAIRSAAMQDLLEDYRKSLQY